MEAGNEKEGGIAGRKVTGSFVMGGNRLPGEREDLQGADNAFPICRMEKGGARRIHPAQFLQKRFSADSIIFRVQRDTESGILPAGAEAAAG